MTRHPGNGDMEIPPHQYGLQGSTRDLLHTVDMAARFAETHPSMLEVKAVPGGAF